MSISLTRLRHILAVARTGNFGLAAEEAGISQPALSRSIQAFEDEYGLRLFQRGKGGFSMTPAGNLAIEHARRILSHTEEFDKSMKLFGKGSAGRTGLAMGPMMAGILLPAIGPRIMLEHPRLTLLTRIGPPDQMFDALLDGSIELIVGNAQQAALVPGVVEEDLGALALAIAVRPDHPLAGKPDVSMADLDAYPAASAYDHLLTGQAAQCGAFVCEDFGILRETVRGSDCTWLVAPALIADDLAKRRLVLLEIADQPIPETRTSLAYLRERDRSPASQVVADAVRQGLAKVAVDCAIPDEA